jgi:hypothetical protein
VSHLSESILRRYVDEPDALLSYEKEHLLQCTGCRTRLEVTRERADFASRNLTAEDRLDLDAARTNILARGKHVREAAFSPERTLPRRPLQWAAALAAAFALFFVVGYTPLRGYAQNFLAIFEPRQFEPIGFTSSDLSKMRGLPNLKPFGTMHEIGASNFTAIGNSAAASAFAHHAIMRPRYLPNGVPRSASYHVSGRHSISFTFSSAKNHAVPAQLNGATLSSTLGPVVVQTYGNRNFLEKHLHARKRVRDLHQLPEDMIVVTEAPAPKIYSTGATVAQIESWMLAQPGLPPNLVAQIRAIGDPTTTLPVPIELDKQNAQKVTVNGAQGLLIGDNTGVGSLVMWQNNGTVYAVAGPFAASEILQVANSLRQ